MEEVLAAWIVAMARAQRTREIPIAEPDCDDPAGWMDRRWEGLRHQQRVPPVAVIEAGFRAAVVYHEQQTVHGPGNGRAFAILGEVLKLASPLYSPGDARLLEIRLWHLSARHRMDNSERDTLVELEALDEDIESLLGERHPLRAFTAWRRAAVLLDTHDHERGLEAARDAVGRMRVALGPDHVDTYNARTCIGIALAFLSRFDDSEHELRTLIEDMEANPDVGPDHESTLIARRALANTLLWWGQPEQGWKVAHETARRSARVRGSRSSETLSDLGQSGLLCVEAQRQDELTGVLDTLLETCFQSDATLRAGPGPDCGLDALLVSLELARAGGCDERAQRIADEIDARALVEDGEGEGRGLWTRALMALVRDQDEQAEPLLLELMNQEHFEGTFELGRLYARREEVSAARDAFERAKTAARGHPYALRRLERELETLPR
jgi:hypothetical protein